MRFPDKGKQLYLGEGDFSLTRSLCEGDQLPKDAIVTCFSEDLIDAAAKNAEYLQSSGVTVLPGVDATKLSSYDAISKHRYDYIIFNFPHTGHKMRIHLCRALLRDFLMSAAPLLTDAGQVWVTLCAGQGGTAGDSVRRAWADSWQLTAQAAAAGLVLQRLEPFEAALLPGYRPTGNRGSQDRTFHTRNGLIHVLSACEPLRPESVRRRLLAGPARLLVDGAPEPLPQYWLSRLPPADGCLAEEVVRRLAAGAPVRRRVRVSRDGRWFSAGETELAGAADGGDLVCQPEEGSGGGEGQSADSAGVGADFCVTHTIEDSDIRPTVSAAPLRTRLVVTSPADSAPDARQALSEFGLTCKESRQEDCVELRVSCGRVWLPVAAVRPDPSCPGAVVTTYDVDAVIACWAGEDDWRHAVRTDFSTDGVSLRFSSIHPPSYTLDMSFWHRAGSGAKGDTYAPFSWCHLRRALRAALGELLVSLEPIDEYEHPESGRRASTVRLRYQHLSAPLAYEMVREIHVQVLPELLRHALGVDGR